MKIDLSFEKRKVIKAITLLLAIVGVVILCLYDCIWLKKEHLTRIHFISLDEDTDAILLESNGHFGMIDSGEDTDYPDGTAYPLREGVTKDVGFETQVIDYLERVGVKKLDFYIATHAHSDHIGTGDEILRRFSTDRLYIGRYDDSNITGSLWDNRYVYDCIIKAAEETGARIITDLDLEEHAEERIVFLGDMKIDIMNYERPRDADGNVIPVWDENCHSLVTLVTAYGRAALLTADLDPQGGAMEHILQQLPEKLATGYGTNEVMRIDLLKLSHHGLQSNNPRFFLEALNPRYAVLTGFIENLNAEQKKVLSDAKLYVTAESDSAAVVATFREHGLKVKYVD